MKINTLHARVYSLLALFALLNTSGCELLDDAQRVFHDSADCHIKRVIDGDSISVSCADKTVQIRLYCIDAPELGQRPWGNESRDYLRTLLPRNTAITLHRIETDQYGREVSEVVVDDRNINMVMIRSGHAVVYSRYCNLSGYFKAEREAKERNKGVWEKSGLHQAPWRWRHQ